MIYEASKRGLQGVGQSAVERVRTNSAMNPLLWLCGCSLPFTVWGAVWAPYPNSVIFLCLAAASILSAIAAYFIWMFRDPNRLQSEDYQLENQRMLLGDERAPGIILGGQSNVPNVASRPQISGTDR
jgi:hypothetical protein